MSPDLVAIWSDHGQCVLRVSVPSVKAQLLVPEITCPNPCWQSMLPGSPLRSSWCCALVLFLRHYGCSYHSESVNRAKNAAFWLIWANIFCILDLFFFLSASPQLLVWVCLAAWLLAQSLPFFIAVNQLFGLTAQLPMKLNIVTR